MPVTSVMNGSDYTTREYSEHRQRNYYLVPQPIDYKNGKLSSPDLQFAWAKECIQQAQTYLRLQPAYPYIQDGIDLINGDFAKSTVQTLSNAKTDIVARNLKELVASQSNLRIIPAIHTDINEFREQTTVLNSCHMFWQQKTFADRIYRQAWQNAAAVGTGYISIGYDPDHYGFRRGEIMIRSHGPTDVLPIGLPHDHDIQKAYAIILKIPTPYHQVISMFPDMADRIKPSTEDNRNPGHGTVIAQSVKYASAVLKRFGPGALQEREPMPWAMVDLYYIFIDDRSVNYTGRPIHMGDPGTSWEYEVPYVGQMIETGEDANGAKHYRQATKDDCLLYPNRRMMVCTDNLLLTPDPTRQVNKGWHGKAPIVQLRADDWPWLFLGFPLSKMGMLLEKANIDILRAVVDAMNVRLSPPTGYDRNTMARSLAETLNTRIPNQRIGLDYSLGGEQFKPLLPADYYNVPNNILELIQQNEARITHQMGVADASALARARQLPASDSTEKLLEVLGPIVKDQSRNMEFSITGVGDMWIPLCFQWWNAAKRFQILGDAGLVEGDIDWNPQSLVPQDMPNLPRYTSYFERAKRHSMNFNYLVEPYSLHEWNSMTRKMILFQLKRGGFPISWWTEAKIYDVRNFGPKPRNTDPEDPNYGKELQTELDLWLAQKEMEVRIAQSMQGGAGQPGQGAGRKPSGQQPPQLAQKDGGIRSTVRESKK